MKKLMLLMLSTMLLLSACSEENESEEATLPYEELDMYLVGDEPEDTSLVYNELNKLLLAELNTKVNVHFIPWEDRQLKYNQVLSSGVNVDLIYTADWCYYDEQARKGTFREITMEDISSYMPQTFLNQPESSFIQGMINGRMYMVPNYQEEIADYKLVLIRGDLREKYGLEPLQTFDDYYNYLKVIKENESTLTPYHVTSDNKELTYIGFWQENGLIRVNVDNNASSFAIRYDAGKTDYQLVNILEDTSYLNYLERMKEWQEAGLWNADAIANKTSEQTAFEEGSSASLVWNIGSLNLSVIKVNNEHSDWSPEIYDLTASAPKIIAKYTNNGMAIANKSKKYERSLMFLDKLKNDERYWNLTWLGIEGVHWESVEPLRYNVLEEATRYPYAKTSCWGWGNKPFQRVATATPEVSNALVALWSEDLTEPLTHFFRFDDANVRSESTAILHILSRYQPILELGMVEDVEGTYLEMLEALEAAGWATYEEEFRMQYEQFLIEYNQSDGSK